MPYGISTLSANVFLSPAMKRVIVQMQDSCHAVLKQYAALYGWTMSEAMYEAARYRIHTNAQECPKVKAILDMHGKPLDPRLNKECYGYQCYNCGKLEECKAGTYKGTAPHLDNSWGVL
tara:strand:+ start:113 stop:469 length:357 start_codon:yes stop_codon:yes gene_type:complete